MLVRVGDAASAADLGEFLRSRIGAIVEERQQGELEVSLLGSFREETMRSELETAVRRWALVRQRPDTPVEID